MTSAWPDVAAATSPGQTVRDQLDYIVWVCEAIEPVGFHGPDEIEAWRGRLHRAYSALIDSMVSGHGDSLPPDIPPAIRPGVWPDVAAATIPGMTIRHQLAVLRAVATLTRQDRQFPHSPADVAVWTARVQSAYDALDHGPALPMPATFRTEPPPPPPSQTRGASKKATSAKALSARKPTAKSKRPAAHAPAPKKAARRSGKKR